MNNLDRQAREAMHGDQYVRRFSNGRQILRVARLADRIVLPPDACVLDVGCGTGILAGLIAPRVGSYIGVDFSQAMVRVAQEQADMQGLRNCEFLQGDAVEVMRKNPETFDAIFMLDISEHVPDLEWTGIVGAAKLSLKSGGSVYLHTPNLDFLIEHMKKIGWMKQFPEHVAVRNAADNVNFFKIAGYGSVVCETLPHYNILRWLHPLAGIPIIGKFFAARLWIRAIK